MMLTYNPVNNQKGTSIVVGRAAMAIYLIFKYGRIPKGKVILPANICYAAVLPVIYAGYEPLFCDVDYISGNVTLTTIQAAWNDNVVAAIIPHMYGNPVDNLFKIKDFFIEKKIVFIEDCASFMFNDAKTVGDYVVYSTGYAKTLDIGFGGILYSSKNDLTEMELMEKQFPIYKDTFENEWNVFSKVYRVLRNYGNDTVLSKSIYTSMLSNVREILLFKINQEKKEEVISAMDELKQAIENRRYKYSVYLDNLQNSLISDQIYRFNADAVPWRFNLLTKENNKSLIDYCLKNNMPVSDWYPCINKMFNCEKKFTSAERHEQHIINFPLLISDVEIDNICTNIIRFYKS